MKPVAFIALAVATIALSLGIYDYAKRSDRSVTSGNDNRERWEYGQLSYFSLYHNSRGQAEGFMGPTSVTWTGPGGEREQAKNVKELAGKMGAHESLIGLMNALGERGWEAVDRVEAKVSAGATESDDLTILFKRRKY